MKAMKPHRIRLVAIALTTLMAWPLMAEPTSTVTQPKPADEAKTLTTLTTLTGVVTDENTAEPLAGVAVLYNGQTIYSDLEGNYSLSLGKEKTKKVEISLISYQAKSVELTANQAGELNIALKPQ